VVLGESPVPTWREGPPAAPFYPSRSSCQNGKFMESNLAQVNKLLLPLLAPLPLQNPRFLHCRNTELWCRVMGAGAGVLTLPPLHTAKVKETPLAGERGPEGRNSRAQMAQSHLCWLQNIKTMVPDLLKKGGVGERDEFGCCCTPCPCCHVSMEMREGQDVAHFDYLEGWPGSI